MEPLLTIDQLAKKLAVSRRTVDRWIAAGKIPKITVGSRTRLDLAEVLKALERK